MILQAIILILIILNLIFVSISAFLGKKNLLLVLAIIEAILAFLFAAISSINV